MSVTEHMFITGVSSSGKSTLLLDAATEALEEGETVFIASADDYDSYKSLTGHPRLGGHATTLAAVPGVLAKALAELELRRDRPALRPGVLVIVDDLEQLTFVEHEPKKSRDLAPGIRNGLRARALDALGRLLREGPAQGIRLATASLRGTSDAIPTELLDCFPARYWLRRDEWVDEVVVKRLFGPDHVDEAIQILRDNPAQPGSGVALTDGEMMIVIP